MVGDGLQVTLNTVTSPLEHYHYDTFELTWGLSDARIKVTFHTDVKGKISGKTADALRDITDNYGKKLRMNRNMLLYLAPDSDDISGAIEFGKSITGLKGIIIIKDDNVWVWGEVKLCETSI